MSVTTLRQQGALRVAPLPTEAPWSLAVLGRPAWSAAVTGTPAPQGSKSARVIAGRAQMYEDNPQTRTWRDTVHWAARSSLPGGWVPLDGPLVLDFVFSMPRLKSLPKTRRVLPAVKPDVSKLARAVEDSLTTAGVIKDDAAIVDYRRLAKVYARDLLDADALPVPGVVIRAWRVPDSHRGALG